MRKTEEVGRFPTFSDRANEAYRTYASLYLDFADDNLQHFLFRDHDVAPIRDISDEDLNDGSVTKAYLDVAVEIAKDTLSSGHWKSFKELFEAYPMLEERKDELEGVVWE